MEHWYEYLLSIERQKATRQVKKLRKRLLEAQSDEEVNAIKAKMHVAEVDLNYAQYYPLNQRYISLYPPKVGEDTEAGSHEGGQIDDTNQKPPMWAEVERRMANGTLNQLRNSSSGTEKPSRGKSRRPEALPARSEGAAAEGLEHGGASGKQSQILTKPKKESRTQLDMTLDHGKRKALEMTAEANDGDDESDGGFFEE
jgi:hypothetical protein